MITFKITPIIQILRATHAIIHKHIDILLYGCIGIISYSSVTYYLREYAGWGVMQTIALLAGMYTLIVLWRTLIRYVKMDSVFALFVILTLHPVTSRSLTQLSHTLPLLIILSLFTAYNLTRKSRGNVLVLLVPLFHLAGFFHYGIYNVPAILLVHKALATTIMSCGILLWALALWGAVRLRSHPHRHGLSILLFLLSAAILLDPVWFFTPALLLNIVLFDQSRLMLRFGIIFIWVAQLGLYISHFSNPAY